MDKFFVKYKKPLMILALFIIVYLTYFHNLWNYALLDVDETRYVDMSKYMFDSHNYLTLYLNGEYFFEKPPLYFWLENMSFNIFHFINEFSARIPGVIEALLCCSLLYYTVYKFNKDKNFALISSLILLTSSEFIILSKIAILDILLATTVTISILFGFLTFVVNEKNKKYCWWGFYIFSALAILAKGIPGFVLPFFTMFLIGIYTKKLKSYFKIQYFILGVILFLLIVLPWHIIMLKTHGNLFFDEYIIKHHLARFIGGKIIDRDAPFWFYIPVILWGILPYSASFIAMLVQKVKYFKFKKYDELNNENKIVVFCAIAAFSIFLFFESSKTKLITYILPIYPFLAVILGDFWYKYIKNNENKKYIELSSKIFNYFILFCAILYSIALFFIPSPIKNYLLSVSFPSLLCLFLFLGAGLIAIKKEKRLVLFLTYLIFVVFISAFGFHKFLKMDYRFGQNDLIKYAKYAKEKNLNIYTYETGARYSILYYSNKKAIFDVSKNEIKQILKNKFNILIVRKKDLDELKNEIKDNSKIIDVGNKYVLIAK